MTDTQLLDALEAYIKERGYVMIHDTTGREDKRWPQGYDGPGIGILSWVPSPRTGSLRKALKRTVGR